MYYLPAGFQQYLTSFSHVRKYFFNFPSTDIFIFVFTSTRKPDTGITATDGQTDRQIDTTILNWRTGWRMDKWNLMSAFN